MLGQRAGSLPFSNPFDSSVGVRDSQHCNIYYKWVKNELQGNWELEKYQCRASFFFEPTLNSCRPADELVTKCSGSTEATGRHSGRSVRHLSTRDKKYRDRTDDEDLKYSNGEVSDNSMSPSNPEEPQSGAKLPFRRGNGSSTKPGTKRRKNSDGRPSKRKNKKNWVAIFVRGCRFGDSPFEEGEEQPDEQLEEDETENQTNDDVEDSKPNNSK